MDVLFPSTDREILLQRSSCVCSILRGEVPYNRGFGLNAKLDAAVPREAQILLGDAAMQVENHVPGAKVTRGAVSVSTAGRAVVNLAVTEATNG
ncbi:MAG: hypothetical protein IKO51_08660 [Clostridia bacterium]|nr:hypothetical protein [Clostridia bacterium]